MGRKKETRKRIGHNEQAKVTAVLKGIRSFPLRKADLTKRETTLNKALLSHLSGLGVAIGSKRIPVIQFLGERFFNDGYVAKSGAFPLCCIECKKMTDSNVKRVWKEGLAQCLLYTTKYKYVFYVLYDFTTGGLAARGFGKGRKTESTLARWLREGERLDIVVIKAV